MSRPISRRTVLRGLGAAIALPWLEAMSNSRSLMAVEPEARIFRHMFVYVPNGMHMPDWEGDREGRDYRIPKILEPLAAYRDRLTLLQGLTLDGARDHGDGGGDHARSVAAFLTGAHPKKTDGEDIINGVSVDQRLAELLSEQTRFRSLELGLEPSAPAGTCDSGYSCVYTSNLSWRTDRTPVAKEIDPAAVFDRLFGTGAPQEDSEGREKRERYRRSILDFVADDAAALQRRLGQTDRQKLEEYLYAVRQIEQRLSETGKLSAPEAGVPDYPRPAGVPEDFAEHLKLMFDLATLAFQTDSTRVITLMVTNAGSNRGYSEIDVPDGHHDLSHHQNDQDKQSKISKINTYHVSLLKHLIDRMNETQLGDRSLLDDAMVLYGSGISDGNRHNHDNLPIAVIGGCAGRMKVGMAKRYASETPLTNLYLSLIRQAGGKDSTFGDSRGALDDLFDV